MSEKPPPPSSEETAARQREELDLRLREARAQRGGRKSGTDRNSRGDGLAFAMRIGVDLVAALGVGVGIGILLDRWLDTAPWFLLLFFVLGAAAGLLNVYRTMAGYGYGAGYRKEPPDPDKEPGQESNGR